MAEEFSFSEDISSVLWTETLWLNGLRAAGAGIVWGLVSILTGSPGQGLGMLIAMPVSYFIVLVPIGLLASFLTPIPYIGFVAGLISTLFALMVAVGDPIVYVLNKFKPTWVPAEEPDLFSLRIIIFLMSPFEE